MRYREASEGQIRAARAFSGQHGSMTLSQALKYLDEIFRYTRGEISDVEFKQRTGWAPSQKWKKEA